MINEEINVLIVEDEDFWAKTLQITLNGLGYTVSGVASNIEDALSAFREVEYDIILMDINLNGRNSGIELGKTIYKSYNKPYIFITSNSDITLTETREANPSGFLSKPVNSASLFFSIQSAINNFNNNRRADAPEQVDPLFSSFFVKQGKRYKKIDWKDVSSITAGKNYVEIFNTQDKTHYFIRSSLQRILQNIIPQNLQRNFIQINRADAVQLSFVTEISDNEIKTAYSSHPLTDAFQRDLKGRMKLLT